jgi:hypothetical protein
MAAKLGGAMILEGVEEHALLEFNGVDVMHGVMTVEDELFWLVSELLS